MPDAMPHVVRLVATCCPHPASEHGTDGCLAGWGNPPGAIGCMCVQAGPYDDRRGLRWH